MFIWDKGDLNEEQEQAILDDESILLIACPGSGKTRTLTYKIAYELTRLKSNKEFIIAITYTNNAADEIKDRVELLGVDTSQLWIGTIHSFCMEWILKPYHLYSDRLKNGFRVINSHESEEILTELCKPYKKEKITYWDCGLLAKPDKFYLTCLDRKKHESLSKIMSEYFSILEKNNQIDFEQILFFSYQILKTKPIISNILCKLFPFILIDEYQDTKEIQYHIISTILKSNKGVTKTLIVGDPNQSIYDSLGGYPMEKEELEELLGFKLNQRSLTNNYRSSSKIIDYFDYYRTFDSEINPSGSHKDYPSKITFNSSITVKNLIDELVKLIKYNVVEENISPNEICIVAPQWIHLAAITRQLMIKMPDYSFDGPGMAPFSRDIENFWYKLSRIVLTEPSPYMYMRRLRWSKEIINSLESSGVDVSNLTSKQLLKICNSIEIEEQQGLVYLEKFFCKICTCLSIDINRYPSLLEYHISFFQSSEKRIKKLEIEGNEFIGEIENFRKVFKQREGITVSTIHGVKGEEYDTMIGFALLKDYIPHFNDKKNGKKNSKKLLYVLASRARKNLHLISEKNRAVHERYAPEGKIPTPHLSNYNYKYDNLDF
ncbi:ATP-dependent helicase [Tenacibaculum maritimum]|uniref:ATP-dependent helicase n=1 Tax=Tenacibaculum maritimum TaxID=107401 RepID=UPI0012E5E966|nr:ATP-dependent helicase [Tenacibaculum maritimum]CAA0151551.1 DNA helicase [Tenacibaculum maritimum]CAA0155063.1 DNA helicase [Tenacibaculum maritimum]CAA0155598.1 DNA helicase [Tenacibaculum maritimum]CAA0245356.1 DNA helicase [Tenacibaculum maritimum]